MPNLRLRYTALGTVLVSTALFAIVSMWLALRQITDADRRFALLLLVPALVWGGVILAVDRSLILVSGTDPRRRAMLLGIRLALAAMLGFAIAEPLVVGAFQSAIDTHLHDERQRQRDDLQADLLRCNPVPGTPEYEPAPTNCTGLVLTIRSAAALGGGELAELRQQAAKLEGEVADDTTGKARLDEAARRECAGEAGEGLSGSRGVGPLCEQARKVAADFAGTHDIGATVARLGQVQQQIRDLEGSATTAQGRFHDERARLVADRVAEFVANQPAFGLLERFDGLDALTSTNSGLKLREWFLRILLVVIDLLPVLVKFLGGVTACDRMSERETRRGEKEHEIEMAAGQGVQAARLKSRARRAKARDGAALRRFLADLALDEEIEGLLRSASREKQKGRSRRSSGTAG